MPVTARSAPAPLADPDWHRALKVLVANPNARGADREALGRAAELLGLGGRAIREVGRDGTSRALAAEAVRAGADCVIAAGGDGTVHEVLQAVAGSRSALGVVPLGTSNDLAARLGIPRDLEAACAVTARGAVVALDILDLDGVRIATVGGFGLPAHVARTCNALRRGRAGPAWRSLGHGIYTAVTTSRILTGRARPAAVALRLDRDAPAVLPVTAVLFGVVPRFGGGLALCRAERLVAGTFAALIVTARGRAGLMRCLVRARAGLPGGRGMRLVAGLTHLELRTFHPIGAFGDGEWLGERRRAVVTLERRALRAIVPAAAPTARRSRGTV